MKISTKVECGIIALIDIAINSENGSVVSIAGISERQNISAKYLEQILTALKQARLIRGQKGSRGGYVLSTSADKITFRDIINALDHTILSGSEEESSSGSDYKRIISDCLWDKMNDYLVKYAQSITLEQVAEQCKASEGSDDMYYI